MNERPTLTISASCPTCKGTQKRARLVVMSTYPYSHNTHESCPDCTDGTIRQAVSCAGCKWFKWDDKWNLANGGSCLNVEHPMAIHEGPTLRTFAGHGCLSWAARKG